MNSVITKEVRLFAEKLPFGQEGRSEAMAVFEQTRESCLDEDDYMIVLSILAFSNGPANMEHVCEFLEQSLASPFEEVRKLAAAFPLARALRTRLGKERLLSMAEKLQTQDPCEGVRLNVSSAIMLAGQNKKEDPGKPEEGLQT